MSVQSQFAPNSPRINYMLLISSIVTIGVIFIGATMYFGPKENNAGVLKKESEQLKKEIQELQKPTSKSNAGRYELINFEAPKKLVDYHNCMRDAILAHAEDNAGDIEHKAFSELIKNQLIKIPVENISECVDYLQGKGVEVTAKFLEILIFEESNPKMKKIDNAQKFAEFIDDIKP